MTNIDSSLIGALVPNELFLLNYLANMMNRERLCFPGNKKICKDLKWSLPRLQDAKRSLVDKGCIEVRIRSKENGKGQTSNYYFIKTPLISNYTPTKKDNMGDVINLGTTPIKKLGMGPIKKLGTTPTKKHDNEVLVLEELTTEVLELEELEKEKKYISFKISNIFQDLVETFFPQFNEHKLYVTYVDHYQCEYKNTVDETSLAVLKKINRAAEKIHETFKSLQRPRIEEENGKLVRKVKKPDTLKEVRYQINAYHDFCRLSKTYMPTDPEKYPEKLIQADWPFKLFDFVKDDIEKEKYDPAYDQELLSEWLREMYYYQDCWDTWVCKRYNNRIVSGGEEYLLSRK